MRLVSKISTRSLAQAAFLCVFVFSTGVLAQTLQQKGKTSEQAEPAPAAPVVAPPNWRVNCTNSAAGMDCRAVQILVVKKTGRPFLTVAVRVPPDTKIPKMVIILPLGTYLPAGVTLQFGKEAAKTLPIEACDRSGCLAEYAITEAEIGAMLKGADLTLSIQNQQKKPLTFGVSASGFSEAYAKVK